MNGWLDGCSNHSVDFPAKLEIKRTSNLETYLHTLHKATNYSLRVLAYTATGDGVASQPLYCQTEDDVPDAPAAIKAAALTADSILISWLPPRNRNGIITHYTVYSREAGRKGQAKCKYLLLQCRFTSSTLLFFSVHPLDGQYSKLPKNEEYIQIGRTKPNKK